MKREKAHKEKMEKIIRSSGMSLGDGRMVGSGYIGLTQELDQMVCQAAELLRNLFDTEVTIRFNVNQMSGGAYLVDGRKGMDRDCSIGISVTLCDAEPAETLLKKQGVFNLKEWTDLEEGCEPIQISTCLRSDFLKEKSSYILGDTEFRNVPSLEAAVQWIQEGTNDVMQRYLKKVKRKAVVNQQSALEEGKGENE